MSSAEALPPGQHVAIATVNPAITPETQVATVLRDSVVLALRQNGAPMSVRDKGPIWIIYPNPNPGPEAALASPHNDKSVWMTRWE